MDLPKLVELQFLINLKEKHVNWFEVLPINKVSDEIDSAREHNMESKRILVEVMFPEGLKLFNLPLIFKIKEDKKMQDVCVKDDSLKHIEEKKHILLDQAIIRLERLEEEVFKLLYKIKGETHPVEERVEPRDDFSLSDILKNAPGRIDTLGESIINTINNIEKELF